MGDNYCFNEYDNYHINHVNDFYYSEISIHREGEKNVGLEENGGSRFLSLGLNVDKVGKEVDRETRTK